VAQAIHNNRWIKDIKGGVSTAALAQYLHLWDELLQVRIDNDIGYASVWCHSSDVYFSARPQALHICSSSRQTEDFPVPTLSGSPKPLAAASSSCGIMDGCAPALSDR
jgi:hypothetical protein